MRGRVDQRLRREVLRAVAAKDSDRLCLALSRLFQAAHGGLPGEYVRGEGSQDPILLNMRWIQSLPDADWIISHFHTDDDVGTAKRVKIGFRKPKS